MKHNYTIKSLLLIFAMIMSVCGAWAEEVNYATWTFASGSGNYPSNRTDFSATSGECSTSTFYLDGTGSTWNATKGYAFTSVTRVKLTLNITGYLPKGSVISVAADMYYNKATNTPVKSWNLSVAEEGGDESTKGLSVTSINLSTTSANKGFTYTTQQDLEEDGMIEFTLTQTGRAGTGQAYINNITIDGPEFGDTGGSSKTLSSIAVSGTPTKTTYFGGDKFDPAGLVVTGTYSDSNTETITSGITWNVTPETLTTGTTSVSVTATVGEITSASYTVNGLTVNKYPYIKDKLTQAITGVTSSTYGNFSGKSVVSDAVYAGNCAGGSGSVQLRTNNNNSGVISTTSGGYIRKVSVEWNASTTAGRVLDVYGSNTPYTSAADLYATNTRGTKLGSITNGTSTSLTITGDYKYVGIRSNDGAMYLTSVTFEWSPVCPVTFRQAGQGYSTLFTSESALTIPEGVEAYYCTLKENGNMEPHALTSVIPASTPVVLHYTGELTADKTINFAHSIEEGEDASANVLRGTDEALNITSMTDNDFYVLSIVDGQVGFYKFGGDELAAGKAYYMTDKTPAGGEEYEVTFGYNSFTVTPKDPTKSYVAYVVSDYETVVWGDENLLFEFYLLDDILHVGEAEVVYSDICYLYNDGDDSDLDFTLYIYDYDNGRVGTPTTARFTIDRSFTNDAARTSTRGFILDFGFDGTTTGVSNVQTIAPAAKASFDLQGRRVMGNAKGLLIKNGRVMLNR